MDPTNQQVHIIATTTLLYSVEGFINSSAAAAVAVRYNDITNDNQFLSSAATAADSVTLDQSGVSN
jgi:hypothetical protein